jgi:hypothetical protein
VPADPSSPIPPALTQLTHADLFQDGDPPHLLAYLATVPDSRAARSRRHPLIAIAAVAVLAGARSVTASAEWAADTPQPVPVVPGARRDARDHFAVPAEATHQLRTPRALPVSRRRGREPGPGRPARRPARAAA